MPEEKKMEDFIEDPNKKRAVFTVKPAKGKSTAKIVCVGHILPHERLGDETIECGDGKNDDKLSYNIKSMVTGRMFKCNVIDGYLMSNRKIPVMYSSIIYNRNNILTSFLLTISLNFTVEKQVSNAKQLIGSELEGKYEIMIKSDTFEKIIPLDFFYGTDETIKNFKDLSRSQDMIDIIDGIIKQRDNERSKEFSGNYTTTIPKVTIKYDEILEKYKKTSKVVLE
jgi:hypothetical protein